MRGLMHGSILRRFAIITFVALAAATVASLAMSYSYSMRDAIASGSVLTSSVADVVKVYLEDVGKDSMFDPDSKRYRESREGLQRICEINNLEYISIYSIDEGQTVRTYYYAVGSGRERDELMRESFPYGHTSDAPFDKREITASLGREPDEAPERIDNRYGNTYAWYYPLYVESVDGYYVICTELNVRKLAASVLDDTLSFAVPMIVILVLLIAAEVSLLQRNVVVPLRLVSQRMRNFVEERTRDAEPLKVGYKDEISEIADSFNQMSVDIEAYVDRIEEMTEERVASSTELQVARRIQLGLVPETHDESGPGFEAFALFRAAREVGGDFYDLFVREDGRVCVVMADVSGKGVSAALFMSMCRTLLHEKLRLTMNPAQALNEANESIRYNNPEAMFVTAFVGVYDTSTRVLRYANAGHTRPYVMGRGFLTPDPGIALGVFEDAGIVEETLELVPGEGILLYTDGVSEAVSADNTFFGEERIAQALCDADGAQAAVQALKRSVDAFTVGREQFDDLTMLCLCVSSSGRWHWKVSPELSSFAALRHGILELCGNSTPTKRALLALDEAFSNVVNYSGASEVDVEALYEEGTLKIRLEDDGIAFDPLEHHDDGLEFEDLEEGGMGISLMKQTARMLSYERIDERNILTMAFELAA